MSNVATIEARPNLVTGNRPSAIVPTDMDSAYRLAKAICIAGMAPKGMETPEKCMIAIMRGLEVGLTPFMALDKIAIVNGRPVIWGDGAIGLVRGSGLCEFVKERIEGKDDARVAVCEAKRRGEVEPIRRTFSVMDAKKAGLWGKGGPWTQYPERMLSMRARAFALRDGFADVLGGLYLREEIEDTRHAPDVVSNDDEPPAPPPVAEIRQIAKASPPTSDVQTLKNNAPSAAADPEAFVRHVISLIGAAETGDALEALWNDVVEPARADLFPSDVEDLMSVYRKRETALND
jgi:hypothetical protein